MSKDIRLKDVFKGVLYFVPAYLVCVTLLLLFPKLVPALPALLH
jgi:TRAP-type mannitol/chloroaromatic compound transport system permease large subunit